MSLGENIKKYRKLKGLKQSELAKLSGVSRVAIGNYERGERTPNIDILKNISNALQVPVSLLTRDKKDLTDVGIGEVNPNYDLIEKIIFNDDSVESYKMQLENSQYLHMETLASLILQLKNDSIVLNQRIKEYEEYLSFLLEGGSYTLDTFLNKVENDSNLDYVMIEKDAKNNK